MNTASPKNVDNFTQKDEPDLTQKIKTTFPKNEDDFTQKDEDGLTQKITQTCKQEYASAVWLNFL